MARNFTHFFPSAGTNANVDQQTDDTENVETGVTLAKSGNIITVTGATFDANAYFEGEHVVFPQSTGVSISGVVLTYASTQLTVQLDVPTEDADFEFGAGRSIIPITAGSVSFTGDFNAPGNVNIGTGFDSNVCIGNDGTGPLANIKLIGVNGPLETTEVLALDSSNNIVRTSKTSFGIAAGEVATWAEGNNGSTIPPSKLPSLTVTSTLVFTSTETYTDEAAALAIFISEWEAGGGGGDFSITGGTTLPTGTLLLLVTAGFTASLIYAGEEITTGDEADVLDFHDITHSGQTVESLTTMNGLTEMTASVGPVTIGLDSSIFTYVESVTTPTLSGDDWSIDADGSIGNNPGSGQIVRADGSTSTNITSWSDILTSGSGVSLYLHPLNVSGGGTANELPDGYGSTNASADQELIFWQGESNYAIFHVSAINVPSGNIRQTVEITFDGLTEFKGTPQISGVPPRINGAGTTFTTFASSTTTGNSDTLIDKQITAINGLPAGVSASSANRIPVANSAGDDFIDSAIVSEGDLRGISTTNVSITTGGANPYYFFANASNSNDGATVIFPVSAGSADTVQNSDVFIQFIGSGDSNVYGPFRATLAKSATNDPDGNYNRGFFSGDESFFFNNGNAFTGDFVHVSVPDGHESLSTIQTLLTDNASTDTLSLGGSGNVNLGFLVSDSISLTAQTNPAYEVRTDLTVSGDVAANSFTGDGSGLTGLPASVSVSSSYTVPISNLAGTDYADSPITRVEGEQSPFTNNKNISSIPEIGSTKTFGFTTAGGDSFPDVGFAVGDYIRFSGNGIIIDGEVTSFTENQGGGVSNSLDIRVDGTSGTIDTGIAGGYFAPLTVFVDSAITTVRGSLNTLSFEPGVVGVPGSLEGTGTFVDTGATPSPATTSTILSFNGGLAGNFFGLFGSGGTYEVGDNIEFTDSTRTGIFEYTRLGAAPFTDYQFTYVSGDSPASDYAGTISAREAVAGAGTPAMAPKTTVTDDLTVTGDTVLGASEDDTTTFSGTVNLVNAGAIAHIGSVDLTVNPFGNAGGQIAFVEIGFATTNDRDAFFATLNIGAATADGDSPFDSTEFTVTTSTGSTLVFTASAARLGGDTTGTPGRATIVRTGNLGLDATNYVSGTGTSATAGSGSTMSYTITTVTGGNLTVAGETTLSIPNEGTPTDYKFRVAANGTGGADGFITFELE